MCQSKLGNGVVCGHLVDKSTPFSESFSSDAKLSSIVWFRMGTTLFGLCFFKENSNLIQNERKIRLNALL